MRYAEWGETMTLLSSDIAAYEEMRDVLEVDHFGKWVVVHNEQLVETYDDFQAAAEEAVRRFGRGPYLIRQVGASPMKLPASAPV